MTVGLLMGLGMGQPMGQGQETSWPRGRGIHGPGDITGQGAAASRTSLTHTSPSPTSTFPSSSLLGLGGCCGGHPHVTKDQKPERGFGEVTKAPVSPTDRCHQWDERWVPGGGGGEVN